MIRSGEKTNKCARACRDQPIDRIRPIRPTVRPNKGQSGVLQAIDRSVAGSMTAQPPGLRPSPLQGGHLRPTGGLIGDGVLLLCRGAVGLFYSPSQSTFSNRSLKLFTLKNRFLMRVKALHSMRTCLTVQDV